MIRGGSVYRRSISLTTLNGKDKTLPAPHTGAPPIHLLSAWGLRFGRTRWCPSPLRTVVSACEGLLVLVPLVTTLWWASSEGTGHWSSGGGRGGRGRDGGGGEGWRGGWGGSPSSRADYGNAPTRSIKGMCVEAPEKCCKSWPGLSYRLVPDRHIFQVSLAGRQAHIRTHAHTRTHIYTHTHMQKITMVDNIHFALNWMWYKAMTLAMSFLKDKRKWKRKLDINCMYLLFAVYVLKPQLPGAG